MDITPQDATQQPLSDDQELAKALAGVMPDAPEPVATTTDSTTDTSSTSPVTPAEEPVSSPAVTPAAATPTVSPELDAIKKDALGELRPLIDHVDLPSQEKFDTYLLLIRSTDDASLIGPAHVAAQGISDEKNRAQALLEIIKEIDYLSSRNKAA